VIGNGLLEGGDLSPGDETDSTAVLTPHWSISFRFWPAFQAGHPGMPSGWR